MTSGPQNLPAVSLSRGKIIGILAVAQLIAAAIMLEMWRRHLEAQLIELRQANLALLESVTPPAVKSPPAPAPSAATVAPGPNGTTPAPAAPAAPVPAAVPTIADSEVQRIMAAIALRQDGTPINPDPPAPPVHDDEIV